MSTRNKLIILFFLLVAVKALLAFFIQVPVAFSDDYSYAMMARSFYNEGNFLVHGQAFRYYPPLYSILISPAYAFSDMQNVFYAIKLINAILSSLIIIPIWMLAKEFMPEKKAFWAALLSAALPVNLVISNYIMSENVFYTIFIFAVFFTYKAISEERKIWYALAGIFIGMAYLTKTSGIVLVAAFAVLSVYKIIKKKRLYVKSNVIAAGTFILTALPWLIYLGIHFGFTLGGILGRYGEETDLMADSWYKLLAFALWIILYLAYITIATGIILPLKVSGAISTENWKKKAFWLTIGICSLVFIVVAANHNLAPGKYDSFFSWLTGRPLGRYVEMILPLIIIGGLMEQIREIKGRIWITFGALLAFGAQLAFYPLFPLNNISLTGFGAINYVTELVFHGTAAKFTKISVLATLLVLAATILLLYFLTEKRKLKLQTLLPFILCFFIISGTAAYGEIYFMAKDWQKNEQTQLGIWFNENIGPNKNVLIDERDNGKYANRTITGLYERFPDGSFDTIYGFFMNSELRIGNVGNLEEYDYILSMHELPKEKVYETKGGIMLYKVIS